MGSIPQTIRHLAALKNRLGQNHPGPHVDHRPRDRLGELTDFGDNPGALRARTFVPADLAPSAALVVVLHGCTQTAEGYDHGSGWSHLAEDAGFALLFPEQQRANNPNLCFNWFQPGDARRDRGEAQSIAEMVTTMVQQRGIDPERVFITGLSAGGAMAAVMLATYPTLFAGGAVIAGLPYGTAWSVQDALARMQGRGLPGGADLADLVRTASNHGGAWPTLSVWHGDRDPTVNLANGEALLSQWQALHGIGPVPAETQNMAGYQRRVWRDRAGRAVIEANVVAGMGHGTPLQTAGDDGYGASGPHMLEVGVSSTRLIAAHWALIDGSAMTRPERASATPGRTEEPVTNDDLPFGMPNNLPAGVERTIKDALRTAGLLR